MTRRFTCRGFEGTVTPTLFPDIGDTWVAQVSLAGVSFWANGHTQSAAIARVRRKLDAVERALSGRGKQ